MKDKIKKKCSEKTYASKIGPNSPEEARMIHKGVYDAADIWKPNTFASKIHEITSEYNFNEFEDREYHYYIGTFVTFYVLKYLGVVLALSYAPEVLSIIN